MAKKGFDNIKTQIPQNAAYKKCSTSKREQKNKNKNKIAKCFFDDVSGEFASVLE